MQGRCGSRALLAAVCLALAAGSACVPGERTEESCDQGNDADGVQPALGIDLAWDVDPGVDDFTGGNCELAGVADMRWELVDQHGESFSQGDSACLDGLNLCDLPAGSYVMTIEGLDAEGEVRWASTCENLNLVRFDTLFRCNVHSK